MRKFSLCRCGRSTRSAVHRIRMSATWTSFQAWERFSSRSSTVLPVSESDPTSWRYTVRLRRPAPTRSNSSTSTTSARTWHSRWGRTRPQSRWCEPVQNTRSFCAATSLAPSKRVSGQVLCFSLAYFADLFFNLFVICKEIVHVVHEKVFLKYQKCVKTCS